MKKKAEAVNVKQLRLIALGGGLALLLIGVGIGFSLGLLNAKHSSVKNTSISSFKECADAGNPIQLSYPEVCVTADGKHFTNSN